MSKKKGKHNTQLTPLALQAKHRRDYISRLKMVCDKLAGPGWFEIIPSANISFIYENRQPPLTIKMATDAIIAPDRWEDYIKSLSSLLTVFAMPLVIGNSIRLKTMLSEGLTLLHYVVRMRSDEFPRSEGLRQILRPFLMTENGYCNYLSDQISGLLFLMDMRSGNYRGGFSAVRSFQTTVRTNMHGECVSPQNTCLRLRRN